ncbi:g6f-like isoform X2 [Tachysurus ichikawai]
MMMGDKGTSWTMLFSADVIREGGNKRLHNAGRILEIFDKIFLRFTATEESGGLYSCLLEKEDKKFKARIVLLAVIKLTLAPASVIPIDSTVRLKAEVSPSYAVAGGTWLSRTGSPLLTDVSLAGTLLTKLPRVTPSDSGIYTCNITVDGRSRKPVYSYTLRVTLYGKKVAWFPNITYGPLYSLAALSRSPVTLPCPNINGDYVLLYWWRPDLPSASPELIFQFDRWRDSKKQSNLRLSLLNRTSVLSGNFSFLLRPEMKDAGRYQCEVFRNDQVFAQVTALTVLYEPPCCSSELPHELTTQTAVSLLQPTERNSTPEPSILLPALSLLLFLVPVVAVAVGVLLWRRGPCTFPQNMERTLSHYSGEVENIYETPEDVRQSPPQNAVYMDLKLTGEMDVYRELDRYDQCCG